MILGEGSRLSLVGIVRGGGGGESKKYTGRCNQFMMLVLSRGTCYSHLPFLSIWEDLILFSSLRLSVKGVPEKCLVLSFPAGKYGSLRRERRYTCRLLNTLSTLGLVMRKHELYKYTLLATVWGSTPSPTPSRSSVAPFLSCLSRDDFCCGVVCLLPQSVDMWNIGRVMHVLIAGCEPVFDGKKSEACKRKDRGKLNLANEGWKNISPEAKVIKPSSPRAPMPETLYS